MTPSPVLKLDDVLKLAGGPSPDPAPAQRGKTMTLADVQRLAAGPGPADPPSALQRFGQAWWDGSVLKHPVDSVVGLAKSLVTFPDYHELSPAEQAAVDAQFEKALGDAANPSAEYLGNVASKGTNAALLMGVSAGLAKGFGVVVKNSGDIAAGMKGATKGAANATIAPITYRGITVPGGQVIAGATGGGIVAGEMGLPHAAGAIIGGAAPIVRGAITGAKAAIAERAATETAAAARAHVATPAWAGSGPIVETPPDFTPTPPPALPSGRVPGSAASAAALPERVAPAASVAATAEAELLDGIAQGTFKFKSFAAAPPQAQTIIKRLAEATKAPPRAPRPAAAPSVAPSVAPSAAPTPPEPAVEQPTAPVSAEVPSELEKQLRASVDAIDEAKARKAAAAEAITSGNRANAAARWVKALNDLDVAPPALGDDAEWARLAVNLGERKGYTPSAATREAIHERIATEETKIADAPLATRLTEMLTPGGKPASPKLQKALTDHAAARAKRTP